jgi:hypothetical protein
MVHLSVHGLVIIPITTSKLPKEKEMQLDFTEFCECLIIMAFQRMQSCVHGCLLYEYYQYEHFFYLCVVGEW